MVPARKDLGGKNAIVSGSNSGIGYGLALQLAEMGATVYLACRNETKAAQSQADILKVCPGATVKTVSLDTASFNSVKTFARNWSHGPIDILAHNAGVSFTPKDKQFTEDGFSYQYQVNLLSSFLLTHLLEEKLSTDARVIFTSSIGSYFGRLSDNFAVKRTQMKVEENFHTIGNAPADSARYSQTTLMQVAFAKALQARFDTQRDNNRLAYSFEPGLVKSNLLVDIANSPFDAPIWILGKFQFILGLDVRQGSATGVHLATSGSRDVVGNKGRYFDRMWPRSHIADTYSREKLDRLWARWSEDCEISWTV